MRRSNHTKHTKRLWVWHEGNTKSCRFQLLLPLYLYFYIQFLSLTVGRLTINLAYHMFTGDHLNLGWIQQDILRFKNVNLSNEIFMS